jgi:ribosomal protein S18 acetylase RimI-like enzyme
MKIFSIRAATKADIDALIPLYKQMAQYHHALDPIWSKGDDSNALWRKMLLGTLRKGKDFSFLVLECNGSVVGYATAEIKDAGPAYSVKKIGHIGSVFVKKSYRQYGMASMAIDYFMEWFRKNKVTWATLQVDANNPMGTKAWKHLGFKDWRLVLGKDIGK